MREIKFRGKDCWGNWRYGDLMKNSIPTASPVIVENFYYDDPDDSMFEVDSATIGQFTGLKDCKGQEIFEGDILRYLPPWRWVDTKRIGVVVFEDYSFYVKNEYTTDLLFNIAVNSDGAPFEVIGNIYNNPELLEVEA